MKTKLLLLTILFFSHLAFSQSIIITEIMYDPNSNEDDWEWVEIYNNNSAPIDLSGWVIDDINSVSLSDANIVSGTIAANSSAVLYNADDLTAQDFQDAWGVGINLIAVSNWSALQLNNGGDQVGIWSSFADYNGDNETQNNVIDAVNYDLSGFPDPVGTSIYLTDLSLDNSLASSWSASSVGVATPVGTGKQSAAAGGNSGNDIASPLPGDNPEPTLNLAINELRISSSGSSDDNSNYVEIIGEAGASLTGYQLLVISGEFEPGQVDFVFDLSGITIDEDKIILVSNENLSTEISQAIQESNDLISDFDFFGSPSNFLLVKGFNGSQGDDLDSDNDGEVDSSPWEEIIDGVSLVDGDDNPDFSYASTTIGPDGNFPPAGIFRFPNQTGSFLTLSFSSFAGDTPGFENQLPLTKIHDIQGSGFTSPLEGQQVTIEGIVVGDFQEDDGDPFNSDLDGFFVQEEESDYDSDPLTSEGIFVFAPGASDVEVGQKVKVTGLVAEFFDLTELTDVSDIEILSETNLSQLPDATEILLPADDQALESVENMRVLFSQPLIISEYFNYDRFGEIVLSLPFDGRERVFQPTSYLDPDNASDIEAALEEIEARRITLDDGRSNQNPDPARHPNGMEFTLDNRFRGGDLVINAEGVLNYSFSKYRIQPTGPAIYESKNPRTAEPMPVGGNLKVATFNVLNYFTTFGERGADNQEEFDRQRAKIIAALEVIDADIVGLIEIENNEEALVDLVEGLNDAYGLETYDYINTESLGTDEIKVAFIYKPATIEPIGEYASLSEPADIFIGPGTNRVPLAQTFTEKATASTFTAVVNHFKSKGSACGPGDDDEFQGNCNGTRLQAAQAILEWLETDPTASGDPDFMIMGDLNAYDEEDPIQALLAGTDGMIGTEDDYVDLLENFEGEFAYSYVFDGQLGHLDYIMVNKSLSEQITGTTAWHINTDEPDILDYDLTFKKDAQDALFEPNPYRSSDHDPIIAGLELSPDFAALTDLKLLVNQTGELLDLREGSEFDAEELDLVTFKLLVGNAPEGAKSTLFKLYRNDRLIRIKNDRRPVFKTGSVLALDGEYKLQIEIKDGRRFFSESIYEFTVNFTVVNAKVGLPFNPFDKTPEQLVLKLFPNPVTDRLHLSLNFMEAGDLNIKIVDKAGNPILSKSIRASKNLKQLDLDVRSLKSGVYKCIVSDLKNQTTEQLTFIKE